MRSQLHGSVVLGYSLNVICIDEFMISSNKLNFCAIMTHFGRTKSKAMKIGEKINFMEIKFAAQNISWPLEQN